MLAGYLEIRIIQENISKQRRKQSNRDNIQVKYVFGSNTFAILHGRNFKNVSKILPGGNFENVLGSFWLTDGSYRFILFVARIIFLLISSSTVQNAKLAQHHLKLTSEQQVRAACP